MVVQGLYLTCWVETQQDDELLHIYDKAFNATWATRQSSSDNDQIGRRFMWQTREVAYDGIPFNNNVVQAVPGWITFLLSVPSLIQLWGHGG